MKRTLSFISLMLIAVLAVAQTDSFNAKRTLMVGNFSGKNASAMRVVAFESLQKAHRYNLLEQGIYNKIPQSIRQNIHVDVVVSGNVTKLETTKTTEKGRDGATLTKYTTVGECVITLTDYGTGKEIISRTLSTHTGSYDKASQAESVAIDFLGDKLQQFTDNIFTVSSTILTVDEVKNNKAKSVTIGVGNASSIHRNMQFTVYVKNDSGWESIGEIMVHEINGADKSTCTVLSGGEKIQNAFEVGLENRIQSHALDKITNIIAGKKRVPNLEDPKPGTNDVHNLLVMNFGGYSPCEVIYDEVLKNLKKSTRVRVCSLSEYNSLSDEQRQAMPIHGIVMGYCTKLKYDNYTSSSGNTLYKSIVEWDVSVIDVSTGVSVYDDELISSGSHADSQSKATEKAAKNAANVSDLLDFAYPISTTILTMDESNSKKAKTVTIAVGRKSAIVTDMVLSVYTKNATSDWIWIGEVKITDIVDDTHSSCKVRTGGAEIKKAIEDGQPTRVISGGETILGGLIRVI